MASRAILLDALGTLLELIPPAPRLRALLLERHGIEVSLARAQAALGVEMRHYREHCIQAADAESLAALRLASAEILARELDAPGAPAAGELLPVLLDSLRFEAYPEVPQALARWRARGARLVVVSNWDVSLHDVLELTGLRALLDGVITSAEVGAAKPAVAPFRAALALAGADPGEAVHVGDSHEADVIGARAAGIEPVWLRRRGGGEPPDPHVRVITTLAQLA